MATLCAIMDDAPAASRHSADPTDPAFRFADYPFYLLSRASGRYNAEMEKALKSLGLDQGRWRVLIVLCEADSLGIAQIADTIVYKLSTTTRIVQRLQQAGLVTSRPSASDARVTAVSITPTGRGLVDRSRTIARNVFRTAFADVPDRAVDSFCDVLRAIDANLARRPVR